MISSLSSLLLWLIIMLLVEKPIQKNRFFTSPLFLSCLVGLVLAALFFLPLGEISLARWSASLMSNTSIPLIGLLLVLLVERLFSCTLFRPQDWKTAWMFGACGGLLLYPAALGLGRIDPYSWGWGNSPFFIVVGFLILILLIAKNRFAILLLVAIAAFDSQFQASTNLWDYLIDPIYAVIALVMGIGALFFREKEKVRSHLFVP
ncbi:MAG: hypothetical protein ACOYK6_06350 [Chthoniobacterales bacterium]